MVNLGIARLEVERNGRSSIVRDQYSQVPLQLHRPLYLDDADFPTVYLKSPSSGLLEGDEHKIDVSIGDNGRLELRTQAATLVYPGSSLVTVNIKVAAGGRLTYLPHVVILSSGSRLTQRVNIEVEPTSRIDYCDTWCAGRIAMNESWQFLQYDYLLEVSCAGQLIYRERWNLVPGATDTTHPLLCGDFTHFASHYRFGAGDEPEPMALRPGAASVFEESKEWKLKRGSLLVQRRASKVSSRLLVTENSIAGSSST
jgi:urease accessory protein